MSAPVRLFRFVGYAVEPVRAVSAFAAAVAMGEALAETDHGALRSVSTLRSGDFRLRWERPAGFGVKPMPISMDVTIVEETAPPGATLDGKLNPLRAEDA